MSSPDEVPEGGRGALPKAVDLLARRPHFRAELAAKLERRGFSDAEVDAALARLDELGYLDDRGTAAAWVRSTVERKCWGPRRLRAELGRRGVEETIVDAVVPPAFPGGERPIAERAAERWRGRDPRALARHLERRGFSSAVIIEIVERFAGDDEPRS